jgi:hypothetical protein
MKRVSQLLIFGGALLAVGYMTLPALVSLWSSPRKPKRSLLLTKIGDSVEIRGQNSKIVVEYIEAGSDGPSIVIEQRFDDGNNGSVTVSPGDKNHRYNVSYFRENNGIDTISRNEDENGVPATLAVGKMGAFKFYRRKEIEWTEQETMLDRAPHTKAASWPPTAAQVSPHP